MNQLNALQQTAVKATQKRVLVLAGAGSGKTKTLLQKIRFLVEDKKVQAANILAITFTKNAANEMLDRLILEEDRSGAYAKIIYDKSLSLKEKNQDRFDYQKKFSWINNLTIRTFHSLCFKIMQSYGVKEFDNKFKLITDEKNKNDEAFSKIIAEETIHDVFHKLLIRACENQTFIVGFKKFIIDYYVDKAHIEKPFLSNKYQNFKIYTTLAGDKVRSKSEQSIADWLYRHNIKYIYEPQINISDFNFKPDFYIADANLYLEHVSKISHPTKNKEEQFKKGNINFVKTFEEMTHDTAYFNHVLDNIFKNKLSENYTLHRILNYQEEFSGYQEEIKDFIRDVIRINDMLKVEDANVDNIYKKSQRDAHERVRSFYFFTIPLIKAFNNYCIDKSYLDFNDLISRSVQLLAKNPDIKRKIQEQFQYVLVDEFQDVNNLQVQLLDYLITPKTQLFCVGDDWQSIYGFRGSNVEHILQFEKTFKTSKIIKLNRNYRSTEHIVGASNEVIKHNKFKIEKDILASKKSPIKVMEFAGTDIENNVRFAIDEVQKLLNNGIENDEILFLYRRTKMYSPYFLAFRKLGIKISAKTIHAAKGLEAKVVFIVGLTDGYGGFPDIWLEDRIFQVIKKANHDALMEEERRLFYVAITRAKDQLYLMTEKGNTSRFVNEIPPQFKANVQQLLPSLEVSQILCKSCQTLIDVHSNFCLHCGKKIRKSAIPKTLTK